MAIATIQEPKPLFPMAGDEDRERLIKIEQVVLHLEKLRTVEHDNLEKRVVSLESWRKWLLQIVVGAVIVAVLGYFVLNRGGG